MKSARLFLIPTIACESQVFNYGVLFSEEKTFLLSQDCSVRVPDYLLSCGEEVLGYLTGTNTLNERKMRIALDSVVDDDNVQNPAFRIFKSSLEAELEASEIYQSYRARVPPSPAETPQHLSAPNKKQKTEEPAPSLEQVVVEETEEASDEQPASPASEDVDEHSEAPACEEEESEQSEEGTFEDGPHWASFHHKKGTKTIYLTGIGCSVDGKMFSAEFAISRYSNKKVELFPYFDFANLDKAVETLSFSSLCTVLMNIVHKGDWKFSDQRNHEIAALSFVNVFDMKLSVQVVNIRDSREEIYLALINQVILTGTPEEAEDLDIAVHRRYLTAVNKNQMESEAAKEVSEKLGKMSTWIGIYITSSNLVDLYEAEFDLLNFSSVRSLCQRSLTEPMPKCDDEICDYEDRVEGEEDEDEDADEEEEDGDEDEKENDDEITEVAEADED